ncbi:hypothetical protein ACFC51_32960 [Streptomyces sp. NPDC055962]|uniref:hypothetical protein n=1 Tax=Streptomyces sp. NPDC055962 TaxID=3345667 RepID=UPI0035D54C09
MTIATAPLSTKVSRSRLQEPLFAWLEPTTPKRVEEAPEPEQKTAPPPEAPAEEEEAPDLSHVWVVAAEVEVTPKIASIADHRGSFKASEGLRVDALEVYCKGCRRPYDEVTGQDCAAQIDNRHLIGGDQSKRAKRKIPTPPPTSKIIPGGRIHRRGIDAYMSGVSRPPR